MHVIVHVDIYFFLSSVSFIIILQLYLLLLLCIIFVPIHKNIYIALLF